MRTEPALLGHGEDIDGGGPRKQEGLDLARLTGKHRSAYYGAGVLPVAPAPPRRGARAGGSGPLRQESLDVVRKSSLDPAGRYQSA